MVRVIRAIRVILELYSGLLGWLGSDKYRDSLPAGLLGLLGYSGD